ncbi:MAG: hypothetical protein A2X36_16605 [Elusimicrobia bacterium GWA2_69_24]|nr:MAG: hypothetical protein A2X36_16605 [Elusimicrobia bacterium GWA2_69_24]HBL17067.1 hypothetical protein [Elusimicrobiota bacterium]
MRAYLAGALFCLLTAAAAAAAPSATAPCPDCSLVLIGLDDVRADRVKAASMPRLERFARDAAVFTQAVSPAPWTLPAFVSLFTALHPSHHGVVNRYSDPSVDPPVPAVLGKSAPGARTLADVLRAKGFRTAAFTGGAGLSGASGLSSGFEVYADSRSFGGFDLSVPEALAWLETRKAGERFFLFVHGYDAHGFHAGHFPPEEDERFRSRRDEGIGGARPPADREERGRRERRYDEALGRLDRNLAPLLDRLDRPELRGKVVVAVVGDHGEELFEHGGVDHGLTLYDELLRVPLLLRVPGVKGRRVGFQVRTLDLMPTLLELLGAAPDPALAAQMEGVSLLPALRGETMTLDAFSETDFLLHASLRSLRTADGWKGIYDRRTQKTQVFRPASDPGERRDLAAKAPARRQELEGRILAAFDQEPLAPGAQAVVSGRWKKVREGGEVWLFDLWQDPLRGMSKVQAQRPAAVPPEILEKMRREGYW